MSDFDKSALCGIDASKEISLLEYGLLIMPSENNEHFAVYKIGDNLFDYGYISESTLNELINGNGWAKSDDIDTFLSYVGQTRDEWLGNSMAMKLYDCLNYWGHENIMGASVEIEATADDDSNMFVTLLTSGNFGCILYKPKK